LLKNILALTQKDAILKANIKDCN